METEERIDYEKLKDQERIAFYDEVILFEDELADNGAAVFSVKIVSIGLLGNAHCYCGNTAAGHGQRFLRLVKILLASGWGFGEAE